MAVPDQELEIAERAAGVWTRLMDSWPAEEDSAMF